MYNFISGRSHLPLNLFFHSISDPLPLEITCINKTESSDAIRITRVGGFHQGSRWSLGISQIIHQIETGNESYYISYQKNTIPVTVITNGMGNRYIQALKADGHSNALLDLPQCIF